MGRSGGRPRGNSKLVAKPTTETDALNGQWTRDQIEAQDAAFVTRLAAAIKAGRENAPMPLAQKNSPGMPGLDQSAEGASVAAFGL
jgi:hypothetical protein